MYFKTVEEHIKNPEGQSSFLKKDDLQLKTTEVQFKT